MKPIENQILLNQMQWRYATEKFDPVQKIPADDWNTLEQALIASASSYNLQPWHFVVITSEKIKTELLSAAHGQPQVTQASHLVVFTVKKEIDEAHVQRCVDRTAQVRGVTVESLHKYKRSIMRTLSRQDSATTEAWSVRQVYIAIGNLLTCAAMLGIDACPMEGIDPGKVDQILELGKKGFGSLAFVTLGYRAADDVAAKEAKVRFAAGDVVTRIE